MSCTKKMPSLWMRGEIVTKEERNMIVESYIEEIRKIARFEFSRFNAPWSFDAEDLFQEAVCRLLKDVELWDESKSGFRTFVHSRSRFGIKDAIRIRTNTAKVALLSDYAEDLTESPSYDFPFPSGSDYVEAKMMFEYVLSKFACLPHKEREVMISHFIEGESLTEHSEGEGFSLAWASLLRDKALLKIKTLIRIEEDASRSRNKNTPSD